MACSAFITYLMSIELYTISFFVTKYCQKIQKIYENLWRLANIDREFLQFFWTTWGNSMKFPGKRCLKIIWKSRKTKVSLSL